MNDSYTFVRSRVKYCTFSFSKNEERNSVQVSLQRPMKKEFRCKFNCYSNGRNVIHIYIYL